MPEESKKDESKKDFGEGIEVVKDTSSEERDIDINFRKILSFFRKGSDKKAAGKADAKAAQQPMREKSDDDVSINLQAVSGFLAKWGAAILVIAGVLISLGLTANVRLQPEKLPFADEWAANSVYGTIQGDIESAISSQYPNLPDDRKSQILSDEMAKARSGKTYTFKTGQYAGQAMDIKSQIDGTANFIKDFYKDETGKPYSPDIDPYYWYRYAKNIVQTGHIGDEVKNGLEWDNRQVAPLGREVASYDLFFPYFIAYLYKFVRVFSPSADLFQVQTTIYPALLTSITILLIFLVGRKIAGNTGGFFASIMAGLHAAYVNRTIHGDNDAVVIFFAVLTLWCFVQAIYSRKAIWQAAFGALAGLSVYLFSLAWGGWWFIFVFILAAAAVAVGTGIIADVMTASKIGISSVWRAIKKELTEELAGRMGKATLAFVVSTILLVGVKNFIMIKDLLFGVATIKTPVLAESYWPNVLTTVAELNPGSFGQALSQIRPGIFWLAAISFVLLIIFAAINFSPRFTANRTREKKTRVAIIASATMFAAVLLAVIALNILTGPLPSAFWILSLVAATSGSGIIVLAIVKLSDKIAANEQKAHYSVFFATLIALWFIGTIYASTKGVRFVLLLAPIVGLGFGITLGLFRKVALWINELLKDKAAIIALGIMYAAIAVLEYLFLKNKLMGTLSTLFSGSATMMYWLIFAVVLGLSSYLTWRLVEKVRSGSFNTGTAIGALVFLMIAIPVAANGPISDAYSIAKHDVPIMNDVWHDSLTAIKDDSNNVTKDAIITSWWDFGHHFKAITERRVTFDGTTQQYPPAHWVGKLFMTRSEDEAIGILRMLDCGSSNGFDEVNKVKNDFDGSIKIIHRLITINSRAEAKSALVNDYGFTGAQAETVLNYTHCDPPEGYVIASEDMIGKSGVWGHFGSWDFEKAIIWQTLRSKSQKDAVEFMMNKFNYSEEKAKKTYNEIRLIKEDTEANSWISPWPSYSGDVSGCGVFANNTEVRCNNGLVVNLTNNDAYFPIQEGKVVHPETFVYVTSEGGKEEVVERTYTSDVAPQRLSVILAPQDGGYYAVVASPELAGGMFTRMFFLGGRGLTHFKLLSHKQGLTGTNVYVYKALWDTLK